MLRRITLGQALTAAAAFCLAPASLYGQAGFGGMGGFGGLPSNVGNAGGAPVATIAPFASVLGSYNQNLAPISDLRGARKDFTSASAMGGVTGFHSWAHTQLGIGYLGNVNYGNYFSRKWTQNHAAMLSVSHKVSPRLMISAGQVAGTSLGGFGLGAGLGGFGGFGGLGSFGLGSVAPSDISLPPAFGNPGINGVVDAELFNTRTKYYLSTAQAEYQLSPRWSIGGGGGANFVRRSGSLFGSDSQFVGANVGYRIDSRSSLSPQYSHYWVQYPGQFGNVRGQTLGLQYGHEFSNKTRFALYAGVMEIRSEFVGEVALDPAIAELLGQGTSFQIQKVRYRSGAGGGMVSKSWNRSGVSASYFRGMTPGNGLLLAGVRETGTFTYNYSSRGRWGANGTLFAGRAKGVVGVALFSYTYQSTGGVGYRLGGNFFLTSSLGYQIQQVQNQPRGKGLMASGGVTWSPRDFSLSF